MSKPKHINVFGRKHAYVGNPSPEMLKRMQELLEDVAMGKVQLPDLEEPEPPKPEREN